MVKFLLKCVEIGYGCSCQEIIALVQAILEKRGVYQVSLGWWDSFRRRHPQLTLRTSGILSYCRVVASDREILDCYFNLLEETLAKNGLSGHLSQIETGMPLNPKPVKTITKLGAMNHFFIGGNNKVQVTVLACISASRYCIPPMVLFDRKRLNYEFTVGKVLGTMYGLSEKGWMDSELFHLWLTNHFLHYAPSLHPLLLLMDGHSNYFSPDFIRHTAKVLFSPFLPTHLVKTTKSAINLSSKSKTVGILSEHCQTLTCRNSKV